MKAFGPTPTGGTGGLGGRRCEDIPVGVGGSGALSKMAAMIAATVRMTTNALKAALAEHAGQNETSSFEAYAIAVAIREANPPVDIFPAIIRELPRLAEYAQGSIRDVEREIRKLYRHYDE